MPDQPAKVAKPGPKPKAKPDPKPADPDEDLDDDEADAGPLVSGFGFVSAVLGVVCAAAIALTAVLWTDHREYEGNLQYQARAARAAYEWTELLINLNPDNIDSSLRSLHERTAGELSDDFDTTIAPFRDVVQRLRSRTTGQVLSATFEAVHNDVDPKGKTPPAPPPFAKRTDTVLVIATSRSENASGDKPKTVSWNLRIAVSDVDDRLLVSRLEMVR